MLSKYAVLCYYLVSIKCFFFPEYKIFLLRPRIFSHALGGGARRGAAGTLRRKAWGPAGLRGASCGRSKSRDPASNHGIAFRPARAKQAHGKPTNFYRGGRVCCICICRSCTTPARPIVPTVSLYSSHGARPILPASVCLAALEAHSFVVSLV